MLDNADTPEYHQGTVDKKNQEARNLEHMHCRQYKECTPMIQEQTLCGIVVDLGWQPGARPQ